MTKRIALLVITCFISSASTQMLGQRQSTNRSTPKQAPIREHSTLSEVRKHYVMKPVVLIRNSVRGKFDWVMAQPTATNPERYEAAGAAPSLQHTYPDQKPMPLPITYVHKEALVVAVQLHSTPGPPIVNAMGQQIAPEDPNCGVYKFDPTWTKSDKQCDVDIVVKCDDGTYAMQRVHDLVGVDGFMLTSDRRAYLEIMRQGVSALVGKVVYADANSKVYPITTSLEELIDDELAAGAGRSWRVLSKVPRLQPTRISEARYAEQEDVIVFKVRLPDGSDALAWGRYDNRDKKLLVIPEAGTIQAEGSFWHRIYGQSSLFEKVNPAFTAREVSAIRGGNIFVGMSRSALFSSLGYPEAENDWGLGGMQYIYAAGKQMVYVRNGKVMDMQWLH